MPNKNGGEKVFTLRLDNELFEIVRESAERNKRSIAKQIEYMLELAIVRDQHYDDKDARAIFDAFTKFVQERREQGGG